ncbi:1A family penicillin-binding protein [Bacillus sp. V-88]|uniref:PBP1A family penicillin-binding protein n=1 Tax=Rossellomorea vietnamensis TaxID=218284 RepID=A0A6I6UUW8_9BACI|nr:PBP1A family penicillin-binding protein [Rossellomorea vietnamensis]OXS55769.1 monofunctional biosynthetic peptidoglycan transglycosylase [Bacillus sp. DSM 27956]PRX71479.1 1A family penicillin-binding protein [Bacillus sp. V-88]QHE63471.1 PBP1A family penicillin-binding protein [Rossellomorea vietnamensis]SLK24464.1 penicillin-binding protein, 1A family [Bacillus sp. V-88]
MEVMARMEKTKKYARFAVVGALAGLVLFLVGIMGVLIYAKVQGPPPLAVPQSTLIYGEDGSVIGETNTGEKRYWVGLKEISPALIEATISIEDKSFYQHYGFDLKRMAGAALADVKAMSKVQGASTISQQYARNLFLSHDKTWKRKISEALYTIRIEMNYSKKDILEGYLNTIYYGHGAYGVQAASQYYFGKDANQLTVAEAAMLAGIPKAPSYYSPVTHMENSKKRQELILQSMTDDGFITKEQEAVSKVAPIRITGEHAHQKAETAPYFQDVVKSILRSDLGIEERTIEMGGLKVYTTLNPDHQKVAEKVVKEQIPNESEIQLGFVSMNPKNGYVTALVGGRDYEESPFNRAVQAIRQPGSTIKPLLYYSALKQGFTPSTTMKSEMTSFTFDDGKKYTPHNYNNKYADGDITLAQAIALSDNVYAVKTHLFIGQDTLTKTAKEKFGLTTKVKKYPSSALGTSGARVIDMVNAYSIFANGGYKVKPVFITKVEDWSGKVIYESESKKEQVLDPDLTYVMTHMLTGIFDPKLNDYSTVTGIQIKRDATRPYAGKSGTTNTDNWMIGYSPQLTAGVWTGYDKGKEVSLVDDKYYAKKIWVHFMEEALKDEPVKNFKPTKGVVGVAVNPHNGLLATKDCPVQRFTYFVKGTEPTEYCHEHLGEKEAPKEKAPEKEKKSWYDKVKDWIF